MRFAQFPSRVRRASQTHLNHRRPLVEALEDRLLLSAAQTRPDYTINTLAAAQVAPAVDLAVNGDFVVAWTGTRTDIVGVDPVTHTDPYFRRFFANGLAKDASQIDVLGTLNVDNQFDVDVAVDPNGNFVVVWTDRDAANDTDIFFQRFDAAGTALGGPAQANTTNVSTTNQTEPAIGMADNGDFIITWTHTPTAGNSDIYYRRYQANGNPVALVDSSIMASASAKSQSDVAVASFGNILITWTEQSGGDNDIFIKGFLANGNEFLPQTQVNTTDLGRSQSNSSVAIDQLGNFDVVWEDTIAAGNRDISLQRFNSTGARFSPVDIPVTQTNTDESSPKVGASVGQFVVAWQENNGVIQQTRYQLFGNDGMTHQAVTSFSLNYATAAADVAMDAGGELAIVVQHPTNVVPLIQGLNYRNYEHTPGLYDPQNAMFFERNSNTSGPADTTFSFTAATATLLPIGGDWDGDGQSTVGLFDRGSSLFYLTNSATSAVTQIKVGFGSPGAGWLPITGDWDADGIDTVGLYDPVSSIFYLADDNFANPTLGLFAAFGFGAPGAGWLPIAGNWDGVVGDTVGLYDPGSSIFYLRNSHSPGVADIQFGFGPPGGGLIPIAGDWDNDLVTTVGLYTPTTSAFLLRNSNTSGYADLTFGFGSPFGGWLPLADDWQPGAGGADTVALYDPLTTTFYERYSNSTGFANAAQPFGPVGANWTPLVGDWNYDGMTTVGLFDPAINVFYLRDFNSTGATSAAFLLSGAPAGSLPVAGDWGGDGFDTVGLFAPATSQFFLRDANTTGGANQIFTFQGAPAGVLPIAGDFDGDGADSVGLYDPATSLFYLRNQNTTGPAQVIIGFGEPGAGWKPIAGDWTRDGADSIGLYDPAASIFYLRNSISTGSADLLVVFGTPGAGSLPIVGDWNGVGTASLMAADSRPSAPDSAGLEANLLAPTVSQAISQWVALGVPLSALDAMQKLQFRVADLPDAQLGEASPGVIYVDRDAAGLGWFIDPDPATADPFGLPGADGSATTTDPRAVDRVDLLSVVLHELGHTMGLGDMDASNGGLMSGVLPAGVRRVPGAAEVDAVFGQ